MELKKVLLGLEGIKGKGNLDIEISGIESNSKNIEKGNMFVAIKGFSVEEGCDLKSFKLPEDVTIIMVPDTRKALAICAANFYNNPSKKFKLIGITGTKGKTTTTFMIKEILEKSGKKVGLIGTYKWQKNFRQ